MFCTVLSACVLGLEARKVTVEVDVSDGMPCICIVGMPSSQVREAADRVRTALKNAGLLLPVKRVTINLAPADIRKEGTGFDLPIAVGMLCGYGFLPPEALRDILLVGELGLDGKIAPVRGILEIVSRAPSFGARSCIIPETNLAEGSMASEISVLGGSSLTQVLAHLRGETPLPTMRTDVGAILRDAADEQHPDFLSLRGQLPLRRAAQIAVCGMHNLLMIGPPGSGKTMTARCIPSILPPLTPEEALEITRIHSIAGTLPPSRGLVTSRPFRHPHHTITSAALAGGGKNPVPGEISLAHGGVLFLDELPEFSPRTLEILRQPLEDKKVTISRSQGTFDFPAGFMLVAAMNPCKCGYYPDRTRCRCSLPDVRRYLGGISQPLLDRFDLCAQACEVSYEELSAPGSGEDSAGIRQKLAAALKMQEERYRGTSFRRNADLTPDAVSRYCALGKEQNDLMKQVYKTHRLTGRSYMRILKVARSIADLDESGRIETKHLAEAISYRTLDKKYWGGDP